MRRHARKNESSGQMGFGEFRLSSEEHRLDLGRRTNRTEQLGRRSAVDFRIVGSGGSDRDSGKVFGLRLRRVGRLQREASRHPLRRQVGGAGGC